MISASKFYSVLNHLKKKGFVMENTINLGGRGGSTTFLEITPDGCKAIDVPIKPRLTRGGNYVTDVLVLKSSSHLKEIMPGWKIAIEKQIQGKFTDIITEDINGFILAIEIECSDANLKNNIEKNIERVNFLIEACSNESIMQKAKEIIQGLPEDKQNKIGICLLTKILRCFKLSEVVKSEILKERGL